MNIGSRQIGTSPYVIAEIGVNHDGSVERAMRLIELASQAGADAVKFQYFKADLLLSRDARLAKYQQDAGESDPTEMLGRLELELEELDQVVTRAHRLGLDALVTIFSLELVEQTRSLPWDAFKTASPDIVHKPLLESIASDGRPMIVSTGASTLEEVVRTAEWLAQIRDRVAMLQCVSCYPARDAALGGIAAIADATGLPAGYSDHTRAVETGAQAVKAGACILERHLTDDRTRPGPDHGASLDAQQFAKYVALCRSAHQLKPSHTTQPGIKQVLDCERDVRLVARQSIVSRRRIEAGETIKLEDLAFKRPGTGLEPWQVGEVVGRKVRRAIEADSLIKSDCLVADEDTALSA